MRPFLVKDSSRSSSTVSRGGSKKSTTSSQSTNSRKEFVYSHGTKLLAYSKAEVPYPFSYEKQVFELCLLDRALIYCTKGSVSFHDFKGDPPKRVLDLGCGLGDWIVDAAKAWPDCTFVGFDVVDVQINLKYIDPSTSRRIQWVHGNFLDRLPFRDGEFDYVHLFAIAFAVPEDKWFSFFDEIHRVLKPGGVCESMEEDAIFPVLPRWFTSPLHNAIKRASTKTNEKADEKIYEPPSDLPHDHACLEHLFTRVFESRFLNQTPCSTLPGYFTASFVNVVSPPIFYSPMPPLAPLPPFDRESVLVNRPRPTPPVPIPSGSALPEMIESQTSQITSPTSLTQADGVGKPGTPLSSIAGPPQPVALSVNLPTTFNATTTSQPPRPPAPPFAGGSIRQTSTSLPSAAASQALKTATHTILSAAQILRESPPHPSRATAAPSRMPPTSPESTRQPPLPSSARPTRPPVAQTPSVPTTPSSRTTPRSFEALASPSHVTPPLVPPRAPFSQRTAPSSSSKTITAAPHLPVISTASIATPSSLKTPLTKVVVHETPRSTPGAPPLIRAHTAPSGPPQVFPPPMLDHSAPAGQARPMRLSAPPDHGTPPPPPPKSQAPSSWPTIGANTALATTASPSAVPALITASPGGALSPSPISTTSTLVGSAAGSHLATTRPTPTLELQRISSTVSEESKKSGSDASSLASSHSFEKAVIMGGPASEGESTQIGGEVASGLFAMREFHELDEHSLFLTMYRAAGLVYGLKEAMWDELANMARKHDSELYKYGWEDADFTEDHSRERFDAMWERYTSDMRTRYALWHPAVQYGWAYPRQDPMTESEVADMEDLRRAILDARLLAKEEDIQPNVRSFRLIIGQKSL